MEGDEAVDPISLIAGALVAGASARLTDTSSATKDAYSSLHTLIQRRFAGRSTAETALEEYVKSPEVWQAPLVAELRKSEAATDPEIVGAARHLLTLLLGELSEDAWKYRINILASQGVQVGDRNTQTNTFIPRQRP